MSAVLSLLTQTVTVKAAGTTTSRSGMTTDDWSAPVTVGTYRAAIQGLTGFEEDDAGRSGSKAKFRVYMHPDAVVSHKHRLHWGSRVLSIVGVPRVVFSLTTGEAHHLEIDAREGVG